jgi:signal transduction histidine kinase
MASIERIDKMQKEFINIAAHELRIPIQPILSLSQILQSNIMNPASLPHEKLMRATKLIGTRIAPAFREVGENYIEVL